MRSILIWLFFPKFKKLQIFSKNLHFGRKNAFSKSSVILTGIDIKFVAFYQF